MREDFSVDVQRASKTRPAPSSRRIAAWVAEVLRGRRARAALAVRLVDREEGLALNRRWRGRRAPTNVLAFPTAGLEAVAPGLLGDIVICVPVVLEEARRQRKRTDAHFAHMVVHGTLHLLGFDHDARIRAREMEALETELLQRLGFPDPYSVPGTPR
jgi:probable rRNA maturation factor